MLGQNQGTYEHVCLLEYVCATVDGLIEFTSQLLSMKFNKSSYFNEVCFKYFFTKSWIIGTTSDVCYPLCQDYPMFS